MRAKWRYLAALAAVVILVYAPVSGSHLLFEDRVLLGLLPDDPGAADYAAQAFQVSDEGAWAPLARLTLLFQKGLASDLNPSPYRVMNTMLMVLVAWACFFLMRQPPLGIRRMPACLASLLLVMHPVASVSIYHIAAGRSTLMALLFVLVGAGFYLRGGWWRAIVAAFCFLLALGATAQSVWLLGVLAVAEAAGMVGMKGDDGDSPRRGSSYLKAVPRPQKGSRHWLRLLPLALVAAAYFIVRWRVMAGVPDLTPVEGRMPFLEWLYGWQVLAAPRRMAVHQPGLAYWLTGWRVVAGLGLLAFVLGAVIVALRHPDATPADRRRDELRRVAFWMAWLVLAMPAFTGAVAGVPLFDERLAMTFSVGVWGALAWSVSRFWGIELFRREIAVAGIAAAVILAAISLGRRDYYKDDETFASQWSKTNPEAWQDYSRRSEAWRQAGYAGPAGRQLDRALMLASEPMQLLERKLEIREKEGRLEEALDALKALSAGSPTNTAYQVRMGDILLLLDRPKEAVEVFRKLSDTLPDDDAVRQKLEAARTAEEAGAVK